MPEDEQVMSPRQCVLVDVEGGTTFIRNTDVTEVRYQWVSVREIARKPAVFPLASSDPYWRYRGESSTLVSVASGTWCPDVGTISE